MTNPTLVTAPTEATDPTPLPHPPRLTYNQQLDDPAVRQEDDAFNRWPFSKRLADTIANFDGSAGAPVIGIYGKWGSGKTSVLNFLKSALEKEHGDKVVLQPFNPWLFKDPDTLLQSFFAELGKAMQKSTKGAGEVLGKALQNYSGFFGLIPFVGPAATKIAEQGGKALEKDMEGVRDQVRAMMQKAEKKVVILIDDLDRLDRDEILQMLKVVRLTANFPNVVYLLAFDDEMVSRAIAQKYGSGDDAGRQFLEKIVQYPFTLPAVSRERLVEFVEQQAKAACDHAGITLDNMVWWEFRHEIVPNCLARRLTTPRQAIRYGNALRFVLPMMKGEVHVLDQMGIEGLRVLYPTLYAAVRDNKDAFTLASDPEEYPDLNAADDIHRHAPRSDDNVKEIDRRVAEAMKGAGEDEARSGRALVAFLFENEETAAQGVARRHYFGRYFSYGIATDGIGDLEIDALLRVPDTETGAQETADLFARLVSRNFDELVGLLLKRLPRLDKVTAMLLARLIILTGPAYARLNVIDLRRIAFLLAQLVLHAARIEQLSQASAKMVGGSLMSAAGAELPLVLALELRNELDRAILQEKRRSEERGENFEAPIQEPDWHGFNAALGAKLAAHARADWRSMMERRPRAPTWLDAWHRYDAAGQRAWLTELLLEHPEAVAPLLRSCIKDASELSFSVNQDSIRSLIHMETLIAAAEYAAAAATEPRDAEVIQAFLAWAAAQKAKGTP